MNDKVQHPAKFSSGVLSYIDYILEDRECKILDPFAGVGGIFSLESDRRKVFAVEIEPEWASESNAIVANALHLPFPNNIFDVICTSPVYGNRMSDHHEAKDASKRITYRHILGRKLHPENSGQLQWGDKYRYFHIKAWKECSRVLRRDGVFILNISDHYRKGERQEVSRWHLETLFDLGYRLIAAREITTPRMRFGSNNDLRATHENIFVMQRSEYGTLQG